MLPGHVRRRMVHNQQGVLSGTVRRSRGAAAGAPQCFGAVVSVPTTSAVAALSHTQSKEADALIVSAVIPPTAAVKARCPLDPACPVNRFLGGAPRVVTPWIWICG